MNEESLIAVSILICYFIREILYHYQTQKMVNKLMSRNFHDYQFSKHIDKTLQSDQPNLGEALKEEEAFRENLAPITSFMG